MSRKDLLAAAPLALAEAQEIAGSIVGEVRWRGAEGWCVCPGIARHTTRNSSTDCKVVCEPVALAGGTLKPGVFCFHDSCRAECEAASFALRSALGKRAPSDAPRRAPAVAPERLPDPVFDPAKLQRLAVRLPGVGARWMAARSPAAIEDATAESFLRALYQPGEKVIVFSIFESQGQYVWEHREPPPDPPDPRGLGAFRAGQPLGVWFLANPVSGEFVTRECGWGRTRRTYRTVTSFPYLVVESDQADRAHWLAAVAQMPLPIAAICTSGGKSIHALVRVDAATKPEWDEKVAPLKGALITLGADRKTMSAVRLTRLPFCERLGKTDEAGVYVPFPAPRVQRLLYLNGQPDETPIAERRFQR
jgi:hypothetical protein